jgi:hypothetical protein
MKYLVIDFFNGDYFTTEETTIDELVNAMYNDSEEFDLDKAKESFFDAYDVFEIKGELVKIN